MLWSIFFSLFRIIFEILVVQHKVIGLADIELQSVVSEPHKEYFSFIQSEKSKLSTNDEYSMIFLSENETTHWFLFIFFFVSDVSENLFKTEIYILGDRGVRMRLNVLDHCNQLSKNNDNFKNYLQPCCYINQKNLLMRIIRLMILNLLYLYILEKCFVCNMECYIHAYSSWFAPQLFRIDWASKNLH